MATKKRKGPGGPNRSPGRVTAPGPVGRSGGPTPAPRTAGGAPGRPAPAALVELVLDQFADVLPADAHDPQHVAEIWADEFLGPGDGGDPELAEAMATLAEGLALWADAAADLVLAGLARAGTARGLDVFADAWAVRRRDPLVDLRAAALGDDRLGDAIEISHPTGDGVTLVVGVANPAGDYTVGVYLDQNLGGIAVDVLIGPPLDEVRALYAPAANTDDFTVAELDPADLARRVARGMAITERMSNAPIGEDFLALVPFVARRLDLLPRRALAPAATHLADRIPAEERAALVAEFLSSPEAEALPAADRDATEAVVDAWTEQLARHALGSLRRASSLLVEGFCRAQFPALDLAADPLVAAAAPAALGAWIRFAARTGGLPDRWRDEALATLDRCAPALAGLPVDEAP